MPASPITQDSDGLPDAKRCGIAICDDGYPTCANSEFSRKTPFTTELPIDYNKYPSLRGRKVVGVDGLLYDVTAFIPYHPGGAELLERFVGKDVTSLVHAFHDKQVLASRPAVGEYEAVGDRDPAVVAFRRLREKLRAEGYFTTSLRWYGMKVLVCFAMFALCAVLLHLGEVALGAGAMAIAWQQCGFFMHDFMHSQLTHNRHTDRWWGMLFGTVGIGIGSHWWKKEHFEHHALTNTVDYETGWSDPQMREDVWAQHEKLFPFFTNPLQRFLVRIQAVTWLPVTVLFGRIGITIDGFREERRVYEWIALLLHFAILSMYLSLLPTWGARGYFYLLCSVGQGVLSIQLLISHYSRPFFIKDTEYHNVAWERQQVIANINIINPVWMDWFHGGLNFHIEHHLFPTMPRHNLRAAALEVKRVCRELGIEYIEMYWSTAVRHTVIHLAQHATRISRKE